MGTFERIRTLSPWILTAFAVVFILFMALSGIDFSTMTNSQMNPQTMPIATVNGQELKYVEYEKNVSQEIENRRSQAKDDAPVDEKQVRSQMWTTMIDGLLMDQYAKKVGSTVTDEVVAYELLNNPPDFMKQRFMDSSGNFQRQTYQALLTDPQSFYTQRAPDMDPAEKQKALKQFRDEINLITNYLKDQKKQKMLTNAVNTASSIVSKAYAREAYIDDNSTADVSYLQFSTASVDDDQIKITDDELKEYYEKHKQSFKQEASRKLKYVAFRINPSEQDTANMIKKRNLLSELLSSTQDSTERDSIFSEKLRDFNGESVDYTIVNEIEPRLAQYVVNFTEGDIKGPIPASDGTYFIRVDDIRKGENKVVKASHILIKFNDNKDSAKVEANRIMKEAKSGNFAELATKYSQDPGSARNGGDLGFFGKGQMVPAFEEAAFAAEVGDVVGPVESQFGYHIIKVEDSKSEEYKYSFIKLEPKTSGITKNQTIRDAVSFKKQLDEGENIDSLAAKLNLTVQETADFGKDRPTLTSQYLTDITFNAEEGTVLEPLELDNYGYIVAVVSDAQQKGIAPFDRVEEQVRSKVRNEKALDLLLAKAKGIRKQLENASYLSAATEIDPSLKVQNATAVKNNGTIPGAGKDYIFTEKVMNVPTDKISEPFKGENAVFIVQVTNRSKPTDEEIANNLPQFRDQLKAKFERNAYYQWLNQLKKDADIEDMRYKQYKSY